MNKQNEDRMSMFYALLQVLAKHVAVWTGIVPFKNAHDELKGNVASIENATQTQETSLKGVALDKRFKKEAMVKKTLEITQAIYAYAVDQGDLVLREQADYSRSDLMGVRDAVVAQTCQNIHDLANPIIAALGAYGLVAADLTTQQTAIDAYTATVGSPRAALTVRKGATAEIEALVKEMGVELEVVLGTAELTMADVSRLRAGDVLMLRRRVTDPLDGLVAGARKFRVWPGAVGVRAAVRVAADVP